MPDDSQYTESSPTREQLAKEMLLYKMEGYSEDFYCAGWLQDLEFSLWLAADLENPDQRQKYDVTLSRELRLLGQIAGGWWVLNDPTRPGEEGPIFVSLDRWRQMLADRSTKSSR